MGEEYINMYKTEGPLKFYLNDYDDVLIFHVINIGQGLMILIIFPDETTMLFDCNLTKENEEYVFEYLEKNIPIRKNENYQDVQYIDIFVNSHRDQDHYKGIKEINSKFEIKSIWDSGQYGVGAKSKKGDYQDYMELKRNIKKKYGKDAVPNLVPSNNVFKTFGQANIYCLNSKSEFENSTLSNEYSGTCDSTFFYSLNESLFNDLTKESERLLSIGEEFQTKDQHTNCIVLLIEYKNKKLLLTGDSDWKAWRDSIINQTEQNLVKSNILVASHHGSRTFFTDESNNSIDINKNPDSTYLEHLDIICPDITLISCGKYETHHHPNEEAMELYKSSTSNNQVYTTFEKDAGFVGFIKSDGYWGVSTSNFEEYRTHEEISFCLECLIKNGNYVKNVKSGDLIYKGCNLEFKASKISGIADNLVKEDVCVTWEVSNSGKLNDENHQEIYIANKDSKKVYYTNTMSRDLMYDGIHIVRCTIENKDRCKKITKVFKVESI